jgi:hypothetical protein
VVESTGSPPFFGTITSNATAAEVLAGTPDGIGGSERDGFGNIQLVQGSDIQGFSFLCADCVGIGNLNDPLSAVAPNGRAWLVASVGFQTVREGGENPYYLQIGYAGMTNWNGQSASSTQVVFGDTDVELGPVYNAGLLDHRQVTLPGDGPDVWISAAPPGPVPGDYDGIGVVGPEDYLYWRSRFGQTVTPPGSGADGNGNGIGNGRPPLSFDDASGSRLAGCVWDLAVIAFERQAWISAVLVGPESPGLDAYVESRFDSAV